MDSVLLILIVQATLARTHKPLAPQQQQHETYEHAQTNTAWFREVSQVERQKKKAEFQSRGLTILSNVLVPFQADELHWMLSTNMQDINWVQTSREYFDDEIEVDRQFADVNVHRLPSARTMLADQQAKAIQAGQDGRFSFCFDRTHMQQVEHMAGCECYMCAFEQEALRGESFRQLLQDVTGVDLSLLSTFASRYNPGDFLSEHDDAQDASRQVAFVFQLSKDWRPEHGGQLVFPNQPPHGLSLQPVFNSLTLFDVSGMGQAHFVKQVSRSSPMSRFAITGWFKRSSSEGDHDEL